MNGLRDGADLVDLEEQTVASLLFDGGLDSEGVGDSQIVTDNLDATVGVEVGPSFPVILIEWIFNGYNGVFLDVAEVEVGEFNTRDPLGWVGVRVLEVKIVFSLLVEFGRRDIQSDFDFTLIASLLDSLGEKFKGFVSTRNVGSKATLVTDVDGYK